jgi:hypothetical protein
MKKAKIKRGALDLMQRNRQWIAKPERSRDEQTDIED